MFNEILEKYTALRTRKLPIGIWGRIVFMLIGCVFALIANYIKLSEARIGIALCGIMFILVPSISLWLSEKKAENENSNDNNLDINKYKERKDSFEKFLLDNGIDTYEKREWIKTACMDQLNERKKDGKIIMPFVTAIVVPIILIIAEIVLNDKSSASNFYMALNWFIIFFIYYICVVLIDSELDKYINKDYYKVKRFKEEFDNLAFFEFNNEVEGFIQENSYNNDEQI